VSFSSRSCQPANHTIRASGQILCIRALEVHKMMKCFHPFTLQNSTRATLRYQTQQPGKDLESHTSTTLHFRDCILQHVMLQISTVYLRSSLTEPSRGWSMQGEIIAPKGPNMGILKSCSLEETFVTFINISIQACDFSVLNSMIAPPLDRVHATAFLSRPSTNAVFPGP